MRKLIFVASIGCLTWIISPQTASAQFTINIPKIKKTKPEQPKTDATNNNQSSAGRSNQSSGSQSERASDNQTAARDSSSVPDQCNDIRVEFELKDIAKKQDEVDSYTPDRSFFVTNSNTNYLLIAVSPKNRSEYLNRRGRQNCPNVIAALDKLAASAAKKIPLYVPDTRKYPSHNPVEESMLKAKMTDLADLKIFYLGLETNWEISKNGIGIPTERFRNAIVWARSASDDHPYCRLYFGSITQDYAGGGTYGSSYASFGKRVDLVGCPNGK